MPLQHTTIGRHFVVAFLISALVISADPGKDGVFVEATDSGRAVKSMDSFGVARLGKLLSRDHAISRCSLHLIDYDARPRREIQVPLAAAEDCAKIQEGILAAMVPLVPSYPLGMALSGPVLRVEVELDGGERFSFWAQEHDLGFSSVEMPRTDRLFRSPELMKSLVGILKKQTDPKEAKLRSWAIKALLGNWNRGP